MKIFHHTDLDGYCSAAIVLECCKPDDPADCLYPITHGDPFPWDKVRENEDVYVVDYCLRPLEDLLQLDRHTNLTLIDHHITSIKMIGDFRLRGDVVIEEGTAACELTWKHLMPDKELPLAVKLLADYDVWNIADEDRAVPFQFGMQARVTDPDDMIWSMLFHSDGLAADIVSEGIAIKDFIDQSNEKLSNFMAFDVAIDGVMGIAANTSSTNWFFDSVIDPEKHKMTVSYYWNPGKDQWKVSLRRVDGAKTRLNKIAEKFDGGGHPAAASFFCNTLPFPPWSA
jgi:oligoribonuclease NrnB/cAMP/cGMP phosphodiesterase (DHH superfamily)